MTKEKKSTKLILSPVEAVEKSSGQLIEAITRPPMQIETALQGILAPQSQIAEAFESIGRLVAPEDPISDIGRMFVEQNPISDIERMFVEQVPISDIGRMFVEQVSLANIYDSIGNIFAPRTWLPSSEVELLRLNFTIPSPLESLRLDPIGIKSIGTAFAVNWKSNLFDSLAVKWQNDLFDSLARYDFDYRFSDIGDNQTALGIVIEALEHDEPESDIRQELYEALGIDINVPKTYATYRRYPLVELVRKFRQAVKLKRQIVDMQSDLAHTVIRRNLQTPSRAIQDAIISDIGESWATIKIEVEELWENVPYKLRSPVHQLSILLDAAKYGEISEEEFNEEFPITLYRVTKRLPKDIIWQFIGGQTPTSGFIHEAEKNRLPQLPFKPGIDGYTWNDVFDWRYRQNRKMTLKRLAEAIGVGLRTVERHHSNYIVQYGEAAFPDHLSKFV